MAKSRAQRKAERRAREAALGNTEGESEQGKAQHDKRDTEKKRDWERERGRLMRHKATAPGKA